MMFTTMIMTMVMVPMTLATMSTVDSEEPIDTTISLDQKQRMIHTSSYNKKLFNIEHYDLNDLPEGFVENMKYERNDTHNDPYYHEEWNQMMMNMHQYDDPYERDDYKSYMTQHFESRYLTKRDLQLLNPNRCEGDNINNPLRICACTEEEFIAQIARSNPTGIPLLKRAVRVCFGVRINITTPIDVTGKSFRMACFPWPIPSTCYVGGLRQEALGNETTKGFVGAPVDIAFNGMVIDEFHTADEVSTDVGGYGAAFYLTGGTTRFFESQINYNSGARGAGVFLTGPNTRFESILGLFMYGNYAYFGGGFYATNGATIKLFGSGLTTNGAYNDGGAIFVTRNATANLRAMVFFNNTAERADIGRDIMVSNSTPTTFVDCRSLLGRNNYCNGNIDGIHGSDKNTNCKTTSINMDMDSPRCNWMLGLLTPPEEPTEAPAPAP